MVPFTPKGASAVTGVGVNEKFATLDEFDIINIKSAWIVAPYTLITLKLKSYIIFLCCLHVET